MSLVIDEFIARARGVAFDTAVDRLKVTTPGQASPQTGKGRKKARSLSEYQGPCPRCGGVDRFAVNRGKGAWTCRGCGTGGRDGIGLAAHMLHLDLHDRAGFLAACCAVLAEAVPDGGEQETPQQRADREARIAQAEIDAQRGREKAQADRNAFREKEINRARGIYLGAVDCWEEASDAAAQGRWLITRYIMGRTGFVPAIGVFEHLRFVSACSYWHGQDAMGRPISIHQGFAIIAPFVDPEGRIIGCHQTWVDLKNPAKLRPELRGDDGEPLPTKKMRGVKKGGLIPVCGGPEAGRWICGEGIETVCAIAGAEGWRDDTFYCASGDIGNMAGAADPASSFDHPTLKKQDTAGRWRKVKVQGPVPKTDEDEIDAMQVADHVAELVLLADGDSEPVATASAMARAQARHERPGRTVAIWWPPEQQDFADATKAAMATATGDGAE